MLKFPKKGHIAGQVASGLREEREGEGADEQAAPWLRGEFFKGKDPRDGKRWG